MTTLTTVEALQCLVAGKKIRRQLWAANTFLSLVHGEPKVSSTVGSYTFIDSFNYICNNLWELYEEPVPADVIQANRQKKYESLQYQLDSLHRKLDQIRSDFAHDLVVISDQINNKLALLLKDKKR